MKTTIKVQGLELARKSTICRFIRDNYNFQLRNNSLIADNDIIKSADYQRKNSLQDDSSIGRLYLDALRYDLEHYEENGNDSIIQDSTIIVRSIAFHSIAGDPELAKEFRKLLAIHPRFTRSYVLTASDEVRFMRLQGRCSRKHDSPEDHLIYKSPEKFHQMEDMIIKLVTEEFGGTVLDSSNMEQIGEKERLASIIMGK